MFKFGDIVENRFAAADNPRRQGIVVREGWRRGKLNPGPYVEITDGGGNFWTASLTSGHCVRKIGRINTDF